MSNKQERLFLFLFLIILLGLASCSGGEDVADSTNINGDHEQADDHEDDPGEGVHSPEVHMGGHDFVPEEAAIVPNPFEATQESIDEGAELYAASCAVCHGDNGEGDGLGGTFLDPKPANLQAGHVQSLTDGAMFYVISHGKPETSMPAWDSILDETQRWHLVNFVLNLEN